MKNSRAALLILSLVKNSHNCLGGKSKEEHFGHLSRVTYLYQKPHHLGLFKEVRLNSPTQIHTDLGSAFAIVAILPADFHDDSK